MKTWVIIVWIAIFLLVIVPLLVMGYNKYIATKTAETKSKVDIAEDEAREAEANRPPAPIYVNRTYIVRPRPIPDPMP